jgi:hypothetical protein
MTFWGDIVEGKRGWKRWHLVEELEHRALRVLGCRDREVDAVLHKRLVCRRRRQDMWRKKRRVLQCETASGMGMGMGMGREGGDFVAVVVKCADLGREG